MQAPTDRVFSIQLLRAVGALMVLSAHLWIEFRILGLPNAIPNFVAGAAGVDLFFVISGFVMAYSSERFFAQPGGASEFALRRLARIVPLYWLATTLTLAFILAKGTFSAGGLSWPAVAAAYAFWPHPRLDGHMTPVLQVGWTLNLEMFFYVIFAVAIVFPRRLAVAAASLALAACVYILPLGPHSDSMLIEFVFGMAIGLAYREGVRIPAWATIALAGGGFVVYASGSPLVVAGMGSRQGYWGGASAMIVAGLSLSRASLSFSPVINATALLGDASYALYLTHSIVLVALRFTVGPLLASHTWFYVLIQTVSCLALAVITYQWVERPLTKWLHCKLPPKSYSRTTSSCIGGGQADRAGARG